PSHLPTQRDPARAECVQLAVVAATPRQMALHQSERRRERHAVFYQRSRSSSCLLSCCHSPRSYWNPISLMYSQYTRLLLDCTGVTTQHAIPHHVLIHQGCCKIGNNRSSEGGSLLDPPLAANTIHMRLARLRGS